MLSGNKDVDLKIISELNDFELGKVCSANKYVNKLCNDENFWRNRTVSKYGKYLGDAKEIFSKYNVTNWQKYYKDLTKQLSEASNFAFSERNRLREDVKILANIQDENTRKILMILERINIITEKELDDFLNNNLINYMYLSFNLHGRPDLMKYIIERSKTDSRFFPLWKEGGKSFIYEYSAEDINLIKPILEDARSDPNHALNGLSFRADDYINEVLKDPRITKEGLRQAMLEISVKEEIFSPIKRLMAAYEEKGGNKSLYRNIIANIVTNQDADDEDFAEMLVGIQRNE